MVFDLNDAKFSANCGLCADSVITVSTATTVGQVTVVMPVVAAPRESPLMAPAAEQTKNTAYKTSTENLSNITKTSEEKTTHC